MPDMNCDCDDPKTWPSANEKTSSESETKTSISLSLITQYSVMLTTLLSVIVSASTIWNKDNLSRNDKQYILKYQFQNLTKKFIPSISSSI